MTAPLYASAVMVTTLMCGCSRGTTATSSASFEDATSRNAPSAANDVHAQASGQSTDGASSITQPATPPPFLDALPLSGKSVGHTSVVFKLKLQGGLEAAYKPRSKRGGLRYRGEIAAYRLATALGLRNVPAAFFRSYRRDTLAAALSGANSDANTGALFARDVVAEDDGTVRGALIAWIAKLEFLPLGDEDWTRRWTGWLGPDGTSTGDDRALAAQISTLIVFDYVTANWDRWSGGNIGFDREHALIFIDNDGAFFDPAPAALLALQLDRLAKVARFSRSLVTALDKMALGGLQRALGEESPGVPLLSLRAMKSADDRRKAALAVIRAKVAEQGEARVLSFE